MIKRIAILISYILLGIGIISATVIIVAFGQGYSYSLTTNTFSINGLLVLSTTPSGATVTVDGRTIRSKTPYRNTFEAGLHDVTLAKAGYRNWQKRVQILATGVTNWQNILMVPTDLKQASVVSGKQITQILSTRDRKRFAFVTAGSDPGLWVLSPDRRTNQKIYSPAVATADTPAETILGASWADDGSHLLVKTQIASNVMYSIVPSGGGSATNLTQLFQFDLTGLQFDPSDWRQLYWISPEGLRRLNVADKTVSAVLASNVLAFTFAGNDRLAFVQSTPTGNILASSDGSGGNFKRLVEVVPTSPSYQLAYSLYNSTDYITVLPAATSVATVYGDIFTPTPSAKVISQSASSVASSDNGRFVGFIYNGGFGVYDLDDGLVYTNKQSSAVSNFAWFDPAHVILNENGNAILSEYDGGNPVTLQTCANNQPVFGSNDQRQVLCLTAGGTVAAPTTQITSTTIKP
jgi:hypothetical protein